MKGLVFLGERKAEIREFPDPVAGPGQVVVEMRVSAVCGSDVHVWRLPLEGNEERFSLIQGHEPCGIVKSVGAGVTKVKPGDRVVVYHYLGCGYCEYCSQGEYYYCTEGTRGYGWHVHGSMADLVLTDEQNCLPLPPELSFVDGAFISCIAATAYSALSKLDVSGRDTLLVSGLGPVGLCEALFGKAAGARVIGVEISPERLDLAKSLGIEELIDSSKVDVSTEVYKMTKGQGASAAFDSTGVVDATKNTIKSLGYHGRMVFAGMSFSPEGLNLSDGSLGAMWKQLKIMGTLVYPRYMYWEISRFLIDHEIPLEKIVTHRFKIEDGVEAMRVADTGKTGKVLINWE